MTIPEVRGPFAGDRTFHFFHRPRVVVGMDTVQKRCLQYFFLGVPEDLADLAVDSEVPALHEIGYEEHDKGLLEKPGNGPLRGRRIRTRWWIQGVTNAYSTELSLEFREA